jgi:uncharacterized protein YcfJ
MKTLAISAFALALTMGFTSLVQAQSNSSQNTRVVCEDVQVTQNNTSDPNRITGTAIGAVAGGVVGNQIGGGRGRTLATVGGAVAGGVVGNQVQRNNQNNNATVRTERRCREVQQ